MTPERPKFTQELSREAIVAQLEQTSGLRGVRHRGLAALAEMGTLRSFRATETILLEGKPAASFFVLLSGQVKMTRSLVKGRNALVALFGPGDLFGTVAALGGRECDASLVALESTVCLEIPRRDLFALFEAKPELVAEILPALTRQLVECRNCILELTCFRLESRFAQLLLKLADQVGQPANGGVFIPVRLSRQELAEMTGTTIESCIRIMSRWGKEKLVETRKDGFLVRDGDALLELAREDH